MSRYDILQVVINHTSMSSHTLSQEIDRLKDRLIFDPVEAMVNPKVLYAIARDDSHDTVWAFTSQDACDYQRVLGHPSSVYEMTTGTKIS